jgi:hypothetical protein
MGADAEPQHSLPYHSFIHFSTTEIFGKVILYTNITLSHHSRLWLMSY